MATTYKIHPAIGIARVGNSPDAFFIGPERVGERPAPQGGFKDASCRVKPQAARFRVFAHYEDGTYQEITAADADISWTVHLRNKKAANPLRGNVGAATALTIDPGPRTLTGPAQQARFDTGSIQFQGRPAVTVPLGEIRTDTDGRLLVLGGAGRSDSPGNVSIQDFWATPGWYDDIADGSISATITLHGSGATPAVAGSWVIVAPPKFAPHLDSVTTLYDRLQQAMVPTLLPAPSSTSYTRDVHPILERARAMRWVQAIPLSAHGWSEPVPVSARAAIVARVRSPTNPAGNMPELNGDSSLTAIQLGHLTRWRDNNPADYSDDWNGSPVAVEASVSPGGLDRAALEACVGAAFYPGIEAGGRNDNERPILHIGNYAEAFRLDHGVVTPGDITFTMALPWQADFKDCGEYWWPVPRPNDVTPQGGGGAAAWDRDVQSHEDMVHKWSQLGFVVAQGDSQLEVGRCDGATQSITLLTPSLDFVDVPQGPMGMVNERALAITFEVIAPAAAVTLRYQGGGAPSGPQLVPLNSTVTVGPTMGSNAALAQLQVVYRTGAPGSALTPQTVIVEHQGGAETWAITITGNTVARRTAATALILDRSGSMSEDRGDGQSKHDALQQASKVFVDLMLDGDGVGIVTFDGTAQSLQGVLTLGDGSLTDTHRTQTIDHIDGPGLDPAGTTSIGAGLAAGRAILTGAPQDVRSLVVLTDGVENTAPFIADEASLIDGQTFAVGLGKPENISTAALQALSGNHGGYLLVTGAITDSNRFTLQKYFLQILSGISNAEVLLDPDGQLVKGKPQRVPFELSDADAGVDVILLTPDPHHVDFRLQTPAGRVIEPWRALHDPSMRFAFSSGGAAYYRLRLPAHVVPGRDDQAGRWHALLGLGTPRVERCGHSHDGNEPDLLRELDAMRIPGAAGAARDRASIARSSAIAAAAEGPRLVPYSLIVHGYSNVSMRAGLAQSSFEPGARLRLDATLTESGAAPLQPATMWAEVLRPDGTSLRVPLDDLGGGAFGGEVPTTVAGVYRCRLRARGRTRRGVSFLRERTLTGAVWHGGDATRPSASGGQEALCRLLTCLLGPHGAIDARLERRLHEAGFDLGRIRHCLDSACRAHLLERDKRRVSKE